MPKPISEVRKPEIVEAASNAILKNGLPHISYDLIAQEADMSRQLIRHYFPDPIELMVAVCDRLAAAYRDCLMRGILNAQTPQLVECSRLGVSGKLNEHSWARKYEFCSHLHRATEFIR